MAIFRQIQTSFWQDPFVEKLTPEEKFFYLYLMTNSKTSACGVYEITKKFIGNETGYNQETVEKLLNRFTEYEKIKYNEETSELILLNWLKHNTVKSSSTKQCILKELRTIKDNTFSTFVANKINGGVDTPSTPPPHPVGEREIEREREIEKETSSTEKLDCAKDDDDFLKKFLLELDMLKNYPHNSEFDKILFNQIIEFQPNKEKIIEFTKIWVIKVLPENPLENPRGRLLAWIKKHCKAEIKAQEAAKAKAESQKAKTKEQEEIKAEPTLDEKIKTRDDALVYLFSQPEQARGKTEFQRNIMTKFEITKEEIRGQA